jgi:hypothetical protein
LHMLYTCPVFTNATAESQQAARQLMSRAHQLTACQLIRPAKQLAGAPACLCRMPRRQLPRKEVSSASQSSCSRRLRPCRGP